MDATLNFIVTLFVVLLLAKGLDKLGLLSLFRESDSQYRQRREEEDEEDEEHFRETIRRNNQH